MDDEDAYASRALLKEPKKKRCFTEYSANKKRKIQGLEYTSTTKKIIPAKNPPGIEMMNEPSESFTSLSDLINSHLSKPDIQASGSENHIDNLIIQNAGVKLSTSLGAGSASDTSLLKPPTRRFIIPSLNLGNKASGRSDILVEQITNKFVSIEILEQQQRKERELKRKAKVSEEDDNDIIDLIKCLQFPCEPEAPKPPSPEITDEYVPTWDSFKDKELPPPIVKSAKLPCVLDGFPSDMYKIKKRPRRSTMSGMGWVICTRLDEKVFPYPGEEKIETDIVRFDFSTPSPDDIVKESLKKPFAQQCRTLAFMQQKSEHTLMLPHN